MSPPPDGVNAQSRWPAVRTATRTYSLYSGKGWPTFTEYRAMILGFEANKLCMIVLLCNKIYLFHASLPRYATHTSPAIS